MGKRKIKDKEYIMKKIRKLERRLERMPMEVEQADSSPPTSPPRAPTPPTPLAPVSQLSPVLQSLKPLSPTVIDQPSYDDADQDPNTEDNLPDELLQALGTEGEEKSEVGEAIRPELALRWMRIIQTGLGKESRDAILKKYPTPINFPRAVAPTMNAEISAILSDPSLKRDKRICYRQNLTGKLMTCLGKSLTKIMTGNINTKVLVEEINDAAKVAAEIYHQDSSSRKFFALAGANKTIQDAVRSSSIDEYLFGADCAEKIKAAQTIQKTSSLIRASEKKETGPGAPMKKQGNWKGPSQYQQQQQRNRGGQHRHLQQYAQPRPDQARWRPQKKASTRSRSRYRR